MYDATQTLSTVCIYFRTNSVIRAAVLGTGGNANTNEGGDPKPPPKAEKKPGKGKSVANQARDHVSKGALKIVDADSLLQQLIENNVQLDKAIVDLEVPGPLKNTTTPRMQPVLYLDIYIYIYIGL